MTTTNIPTATRNGSKVSGTFYPLQKAELLALKAAKLINNTAYVHFALRAENPFCDRPIEIIPQDFARNWSIPVSSVYEAIAKLKRKGLIAIETGKIILRWTDKSSPKLEPEPEPEPEIRTNSENSEEILNIQNRVLDSRIDSDSSENPKPQASQSKDSSCSQTLKTNTNPPKPQEGGKGFGFDNKENASANKSPVEENIRQRLERLNIPLDDRVIEAIEKHRPSQVEIALKHVENTRATIRHPRSVFLYQIAKQRQERTTVSPAVKTARDFTGWTIGKLQKMYPVSWREAASHFGLSLEGGSDG